MRVFELNTFCGVKSTGRIALEIAKLVRADGGECRIGYGVPGITPDAEPFAVRVGTPFGRKLHAAMRKLLDMEGYGSRRATRQLIAEMKRFSPELVHLHNLHGCYLHLGSLFAYLKKANVPVVWTLHDCWPFTGHCAYFDYSGCEKWREGCYACPQQKSYPVCVGPDGSRRNYRRKKAWFQGVERLTFVAPCEWMRGPLSRSFLCSYPVRVIPNGVNRDVFRPVTGNLRKQYALENAKVCLAVASEWDARKGLRYLCEAAKRLPKHRFVVIGLEAAQMAALPEGMIGIARTENVRELAEWYTLADCFVNPTLEDNMPMVNLEALACGTPVVTFATGGCPEAVDEASGRVVPQKDVTALCAAIEEVCARRKDAWTEGCLARAERFDARSTFEAYLDLYKELCR